MKEDKMKNQITDSKDADKNSHGSSDSNLNCNEKRNIPKDCFELHYLKGINRSGVYEIKLLLTPFKVYCDMETDGGGWTVIQNRFNGSESFHRNWQNYKLGFGNIEEKSEFLLGLEKIYQVTYNQMTKLHLDFQSINSTFGYEIYSNFQIGNELEVWRIVFSICSRTRVVYDRAAGIRLLVHSTIFIFLSLLIKEYL